MFVRVPKEFNQLAKLVEESQNWEQFLELRQLVYKYRAKAEETKKQFWYAVAKQTYIRLCALRAPMEAKARAEMRAYADTAKAVRGYPDLKFNIKLLKRDIVELQESLEFVIESMNNPQAWENLADAKDLIKQYKENLETKFLVLDELKHIVLTMRTSFYAEYTRVFNILKVDAGIKLLNKFYTFLRWTRV